MQEINKARQHQARLLERPTLSSNTHRSTNAQSNTMEEIASKPTQYISPIKNDDVDCTPQHNSMLMQTDAVTHGAAVSTPQPTSLAMKRPASSTDLPSAPPGKVAKREPQPETAHMGSATEPLPPSTHRVTQAEIQTARTKDQSAWQPQTAHTVGQTESEECSLGQGSIPPPAAKFEQNNMLSTHVDCKPVKLEWIPLPVSQPKSFARHTSTATPDWSPVPMVEPIDSATGKGTAALRLSSSVRGKGAAVLEQSPLLVTEAGSIHCKASTAAAQQTSVPRTGNGSVYRQTDAAAAAGCVAQDPPQSQGVDLVVESTHDAAAAIESSKMMTGGSAASTAVGQAQRHPLKAAPVQGEHKRTSSSAEMPEGLDPGQSQSEGQEMAVGDKRQAMKVKPVHVKSEEIAHWHDDESVRASVKLAESRQQSTDSMLHKAQFAVSSEKPQGKLQTSVVQLQDSPQGCLVQPQGQSQNHLLQPPSSAGHFIAPGIKMLHPGVTGSSVPTGRPSGSDTHASFLTKLPLASGSTDFSALLESRKRELLGRWLEWVHMHTLVLHSL